MEVLIFHPLRQFIEDFHLFWKRRQIESIWEMRKNVHKCELMHIISANLQKQLCILFINIEFMQAYNKEPSPLFQIPSGNDQKG